MPEESGAPALRWWIIFRRITVSIHGYYWQSWNIKVVRSLKERMRRLTEFVDKGRFYFTERFDYEDKGVAKHFSRPGVIADLETLAKAFKEIPAEKFDPERTEQALRALAELQSRKPAELIHPLRLALTGMTTGPGMFEVMDILGSELCLARITRAVEFIRGRQRSG